MGPRWRLDRPLQPILNKRRRHNRRSLPLPRLQKETRLMPSLANHTSTSLVKLLSIGDAMTGKTGSLVSLVAAGYKLRILDFDNKLDILRQVVLRDCPQAIDNIEYRSLRDKRKMGATGPLLDGKTSAFSGGMKMLDHWKYDDIDLGKPSEWGHDCILALDSLSR